MSYHAFLPSAVRRGLVELMASQPFSHCLTLNTDRELSESRMRSIFGTFCVKIDRKIHGCQRVSSLPSSIRFNAIAFPEHLHTNAHLHTVADLTPLISKFSRPDQLAETVRRCWLQSSHGAGSVDLQDRRSAGFDRYALKDARGSDPVYFLSSDYHPS